jgi:hypothetical protein
MQNSAHVRLIFVIIATSEKPLYLPILLFSVGVCFFFLLLMSHTMSTSLPHILHPLGRSFVLYSPSHDTHLMRQSLLSAVSISLLSSLTIVVNNRRQQSLSTIVTHNHFTFLFLCRIFRSTRCLLNKVFAPLGVFILLYVLRGFFMPAIHS